MSERKRILLLICIMATVGLTIGGVSTLLLYPLTVGLLLMDVGQNPKKKEVL